MDADHADPIRPALLAASLCTTTSKADRLGEVTRQVRNLGRSSRRQSLHRVVDGVGTFRPAISICHLVVRNLCECTMTTKMTLCRNENNCCAIFMHESFARSLFGYGAFVCVGALGYSAQNANPNTDAFIVPSDKRNTRIDSSSLHIFRSSHTHV